MHISEQISDGAWRVQVILLQSYAESQRITSASVGMGFPLYFTAVVLFLYFSFWPFIPIYRLSTFSQQHSSRVQNDIVRSLQLNKSYIVVGSFDRQNLFYGVKSLNRSLSFVDELVTEVSKYSKGGGSTIIYCTTVRDTETICESLRNTGIKCAFYHGQMGGMAREQSHRSLKED